MKKNMLQPKGWKIGMLLLVPVGIYVFLVIIPIFFAAFYSLFKWSGGKKMTFIGLQNYVEAFHTVLCFQRKQAGRDQNAGTAGGLPDMQKDSDCWRMCWFLYFGG